MNEPTGSCGKVQAGRIFRWWAGQTCERRAKRPAPGGGLRRTVRSGVLGRTRQSVTDTWFRFLSVSRPSGRSGVPSLMQWNPPWPFWRERKTKEAVIKALRRPCNMPRHHYIPQIWWLSPFLLPFSSSSPYGVVAMVRGFRLALASTPQANDYAKSHKH